MNFLPQLNEKLAKSHILVYMAFWNNVLIELDYLGMTNKALAEKAGFAASNIGKGIRIGSSPSADTAVKIAQILGVSVEYLVTGLNTSDSRKKQDDDTQIFHKYSKMLKDFDSLSEREKSAIIKMISELAQKP